MYEGFPRRADESKMQAFHAADWGERADIAETIEDDRFRELAPAASFCECPRSAGRHASSSAANLAPESASWS